MSQETIGRELIIKNETNKSRKHRLERIKKKKRKKVETPLWREKNR